MPYLITSRQPSTPLSACPRRELHKLVLWGNCPLCEVWLENGKGEWVVRSGKVSGFVRRARAEGRDIEAHLLRCQGLTVQAIADKLGVFKRTINQYLAMTIEGPKSVKITVRPLPQFLLAEISDARSQATKVVMTPLTRSQIRPASLGIPKVITESPNGACCA